MLLKNLDLKEKEKIKLDKVKPLWYYRIERIKAMSVIIVGTILLSRVFLMMLKVFWRILWPILLVACIVFVCRNYMQRLEKKRYYDQCKIKGISPADDPRNFFPLTRESIYRERDSWL